MIRDIVGDSDLSRRKKHFFIYPCLFFYISL